MGQQSIFRQLLDLERYLTYYLPVASVGRYLRTQVLTQYIAKSEELVRSAGFAHYTILRPTEFMSNYTASETAQFQIPTLVNEGVLRTAYPSDRPLTVIDVADVGRTAAAAISAPGTFAGGSSEFDVVAESLTPRELVAQLSEAAGKKLSVHTYPPAEAAELAKQNPVIAGQITRQGTEAKAVPDDFGLGFGTFREFLARNRDAVVELYKNTP